MMKLITAVVQVYALPAIRESLEREGVRGMTVTEAQGYGQQRGRTEIYRGTEFSAEFVPKLKLEVVAGEWQVNQIVDAILQAASTGNAGDGKIWVSPIEEVIRVRTGERGEEAL